MKTLKIILILTAFLPLKFYGQCFSFTMVTTPPSCSGCCDGTAEVVGLTGGCPPYAYVWSDGSGNPYTNLCYDSTITVTIIDAGSCCPDSIASARVSSPTGFNELNTIHNKFSALPNPSNGFFTVTIGDINFSRSTIKIYSISGQLILQESLIQNSTHIDLSNHPKGIYFVKVETGNETIVKKVVYQ